MRIGILACVVMMFGSAYAASHGCEDLVSKELGRRGLGSFDFPKVDKIQIDENQDALKAKRDQLNQERQRVADGIKKALIKKYTKKSDESLEAYSKRIVPFLSAAIVRTKGQAVPDKVLSGPQAEKLIQQSFAPFQNKPEKYAEAMISNVFTDASGNEEFFIDQNPIIVGLDRRLSQFEDDGLTHLEYTEVPFDSMIAFGGRNDFSVRAFLKNGKVRGIETVTHDSPKPKETTVRTFILSDPDCKIVDWKKTFFNSKGKQYDAYIYNPDLCRSKNPQKLSNLAEDASKTAQECKPYFADLAPIEEKHKTMPSSSNGISNGAGAGRAE